MDRQESRRVEVHQGDGQLSRDGTLLGDVSYTIEIYQTFHIVTPVSGQGREEIPGVKESVIDIDVESVNPRELRRGGTLTLHLSDGRTLNVFASGDGWTAAGAITPAS